MGYYDDHLDEILHDLAITPDRPPPEGLTEEELAQWRKLRDEVREIKAQGFGIEIPSDIPLLD